jgi:hypothetical protein
MVLASSLTESSAMPPRKNRLRPPTNGLPVVNARL